MKLAIQRVGAESVEELHSILEKCGQDMQARFGLAHWVPAYPLHLMRKDAEMRSVYAVREGDQVGATFTIRTQTPSYYDLSMWENPGAKALYVSRLAVLPALQGNGIGRWCMEAIEKDRGERRGREPFAWGRGGCRPLPPTSLPLAAAGGDPFKRRLTDYYDKHEKLHEFYRYLGYQQRGVLRFNTKLYGETGAVFFEKII